MKKIILLIILILISIFAAGCIKKPVIDKDQVKFVDGKIVPYEQYHIIHSDPEAALLNGEPVSISEKPVQIDSWKRLVIIKSMKFFEGEQKQIRIFNFKGELLNTTIVFTGEPIFLEKTNRILLAQKSSHYLIDRSQILDSDGNLVAEVRQDQNVIIFGRSDDDKVIWIVSNVVTNGQPFSRSQIVNFNGDQIELFESNKEEKINFIYEGKSYQFTVPGPQMPG